MHSEIHINNIDHMLSHILCLRPNAKIIVMCGKPFQQLSYWVIVSHALIIVWLCILNYSLLQLIYKHISASKQIPCQVTVSEWFKLLFRYLSTKNERMEVIHFLWKVVRKLHRVQNQMHIMWNFQISNLIITLNTMSYQFTHFSNTF